MAEPFWREVVGGFDGGERLVESMLAADEEPAAVGLVEEREHREEPEAVSHVAHLAEQFANHYWVHGTLPPEGTARHMFEVAEENDRIAEERAVEERAEAGDSRAHWRSAL